MLALRYLSRWGPCPLWLIKGELFSLCPTEVRGGSGRTPPHLLSWALDTTMCPRVAATVNCVVSAPSLPLSAPAAPAFSCPWMDKPCPRPFTAWQLLFFLPGMLFSLCSAWPALINPSHVPPQPHFSRRLAIWADSGTRNNTAPKSSEAKINLADHVPYKHEIPTALSLEHWFQGQKWVLVPFLLYSVT